MFPMGLQEGRGRMIVQMVWSVIASSLTGGVTSTRAEHHNSLPPASHSVSTSDSFCPSQFGWPTELGWAGLN